MKLFNFLIMSWLFCVVSSSACPLATFDVEQSDAYGLIVHPSYTNLIGGNSAIGLGLGFGAAEFRLEGTLVSVLNGHHGFKVTAEYLSQHNDYAFLSGASQFWNEQHAIAGQYSYLWLTPWLDSVTGGVYQMRSRDETLPPHYDIAEGVAILYRGTRGANGYGSNLGLVLHPFCATRINIITYYDWLAYRNNTDNITSSGGMLGKSRNGLGVGVSLTQALSNTITLHLKASQRKLYDQYQGKLMWQIPLHCGTSLALSLLGQYTTGDLLEPTETRVIAGLMYSWGSHNYVCDEAATPLIKMPEVFVSAHQEIVGVSPM